MKTYKVHSSLRGYFTGNSLAGWPTGVTYSPRPTRLCDCGYPILSLENDSGFCRRCLIVRRYKRRVLRMRQLQERDAQAISLGSYSFS